VTLRLSLLRCSDVCCGSMLLKKGSRLLANSPRDVHEDARDAARALMGTPEFDKSRDSAKKSRCALLT
jgi:hypothetical protein